VIIIESNNNSEFISTPMDKLHREQGIIHQTNYVDAPQ